MCTDASRDTGPKSEGISMNLELQGAKVLVSGGSRGIGRAIVECFLTEGAQVGFCARNEAGVQQAQAELGEQAFGTVADVTDADQIKRWVDEAATQMAA